MKDPIERTKAVIRHLPPSLTQSDLLQQIDVRFSGRYSWFYFRPGKISQKQQRHSRAYIDFKRPDDVFEFAEFFDGHVFVNEKGTQYKTMVEYAPSQRVPRPSIKKDGREGTIYKDPDYLEFLKIIAKPAEHLPSAEIQLERKEAEQAGAAKETPIVTPLMEFVRQKRAVGSGIQGSSVPGKITRRASGAAPPRKSGSTTTKRGAEKKKYILKESIKNTSRKDKSTFVVVPRREDQSTTPSGIDISDIDRGSVSGIPVMHDPGKKKILLLKGKERDISRVGEGAAQQQSVMSVGNSPNLAVSKQNLRREAGGRLIRSILQSNEVHQVQPSPASQPNQKIQILNSDNGKRPPRPSNARSGMNGNFSNSELNVFGSDSDARRAPDGKFTKKDFHSSGEKQDKRTRNKDRPDRGVWAPRSRSDGTNSSDENFSSTFSQPAQLSDSVEASRGEIKDDLPYGSRTGDVMAPFSGRNSSSLENSSMRHFGRRGAGHYMKDDGSPNTNEGKPSKRGSVTGHGGHEKQVWVQKSSGS